MNLGLWVVYVVYDADWMIWLCSSSRFYELSKNSSFFYGDPSALLLRYKRVDGSPDGKRLPPPTDARNTRGVTSALMAF